jgi:ribonuclease E
MPNKMLIDATHPEETRVVVLRGNRVEEFDFESANRKQLRGNIYLAKVTRVEPSLQAAFVDYGGNRHGFLAFSEIHPDYYQIPVADRQALIDEEERAARAADAEADHRAGRRSRHQPAQRGQEQIKSETTDAHERHEDGAAMAALSEQMAPEAGLAVDTGTPAGPPEDQPAAGDSPAPASLEEPAPSIATPPVEHAAIDSSTDAKSASHAERGDDEGTRDTAAHAHGDDHAPHMQSESGDHAVQSERADQNGPAEASEASEASEGGHNITEVNGNDSGGEEESIESVGGADALEEVPERMYRSRRQYKIQEVIKRRQVMLVQVVKEERGTKGAALTTYLSLAGRYSVLMPNTARGGGISRKITSSEDRRRLKDIAQELEVPEGMGVILRTAGASRTKTEVKRDFEYLLRLWETVRDLTLKSTAPTLVYEEGSLVKRSIRDLYNKDIEEILVAGDESFKDAKDFMRMLMPSHAKNVKPYRDTLPVFTRFGIESQLDAMFQPVVQLRSGGYIVLNQTEALVAIDVNSGRATREHHIEDTALKTNMEAAEEIARQLRLRDLAGLIVIDFIDMDEKRNNRTVERRLKESLRHDRARIQVGHISHFGLLEMSRQRIRSSVLESTTEKCEHCGGLGHVRSVSSVALQLLRALEEMLLKGATHNLIVRTRTEIALYLLNHKRAHLRALEERFHVAIMVNADATIGGQVSYMLEKGEQVHSIEQARAIAMQPTSVAPAVHDEEDDYADAEAEAEAEAAAATKDDEANVAEPERADGEPADGEQDAVRGDGEREGERGNGRRRRRRRGRRGEEGRGDKERSEEPREGGAVAAEATEQVAELHLAPGATEHAVEPAVAAMANGGEQPELGESAPADGDPRRRRRGRRGGRRNRRDRNGDGPQPATENAAFDTESHVSDGPVQSTIEPAFAPLGPEPILHEHVPHERAHAPGPPAPEVHAGPVSEAQRSDEGAPVAPRLQSVQPEPPRHAPVATAPSVEPAPSAPRRRSTVREPAPLSVAASGAATPAPIAVPQIEPAPVISEADDATRPRRSGWWSKRIFGKG